MKEDLYLIGAIAFMLCATIITCTYLALDYDRKQTETMTHQGYVWVPAKAGHWARLEGETK